MNVKDMDSKRNTLEAKHGVLTCFNLLQTMIAERNKLIASTASEGEDERDRESRKK